MPWRDALAMAWAVRAQAAEREIIGHVPASWAAHRFLLLARLAWLARTDWYTTMIQLKSWVPAAAVALLLPLAQAHAETTGIETTGTATGGDETVIEILAPSNGETVPTEFTVSVSGSHADSSAAISLGLSVDGVPVDESCPGGGVCMFELELAPGEHVLVGLLESDIAPLEQSEAVTVMVTDAMDSDGPDPDATGSGSTTGSDDATDSGGAHESSDDGTGAPADDDLDADKSGCACSTREDGPGPLAPALALLVLAGLGPRRRR